ncbi:MAG: hypothetical protein NVSMB31_05740 [Vulcanimicrobiaceae bacterium]
METAQAILSDGRCEIARDARLREIAFGAWEGLTWPQIVERFPHMESVSWTDPARYVPEGGEAFGAVVVRVGGVLDEIRASPHRRVLLVAHAGPIHAALSVLLGEDGREHGLRLEPASLTVISFASGSPKVVLLNDVTHLKDSAQTGHR